MENEGVEYLRDTAKQEIKDEKEEKVIEILKNRLQAIERLEVNIKSLLADLDERRAKLDKLSAMSVDDVLKECGIPL